MEAHDVVMQPAIETRRFSSLILCLILRNRTLSGSDLLIINIRRTLATLTACVDGVRHFQTALTLHSKTA